jgi:outer membrane protein
MGSLTALRAALVAALLALAAAPFSAQQAAAQQPSGGATQKQMPVAIAVVDVQQLLQKSSAAKSIQQQFEAEREKLQGEMRQQQEQVRTGQQALATARTSLAPDAYEQRRKEFEKQVQDMTTKTDSRRQALDKAVNDAVNLLRDNMLAVVGQVATERGVGVVLPSHAIVHLSDKSLDITDTVLQRLDVRLPQVTVQIPK